MIFGQADSLTQGLSGNGPAWSLVAILLSLVWFLIKMLLAEKDKRIEDATKNRDDLVTPIKNQGEALSRIEQKIRVAKGE
jgi:hypothetical protein